MKSKRVMLCVCCVVAVAISPFARADEATDYKKLYEEQRKRNDELERRIAILEEKDQAEPYVKTESVTEPSLGFIQNTEISGFVSASYEWNFNKPADGVNVGRFYDYPHDEFMINKAAIIIQNPVDYNAFDWDAGYFVELLFGQDAGGTQSQGLNLGDSGDLLQAFVQFNMPVGNGLKVVAGKYATPIGYELIENEQNANWSGGLQWTFVEPFTHTGLQLAYKINDQWEANFYVNNGWDVVVDNNSAKSFIGRLYWAPNEKTSYTLIGYGGPEQLDTQKDPVNGIPGAAGNWRRGIELVVTHQCLPKLNTALQLDYGCESGADVNGGTAEWYAGGVWMIYDFTEKAQGALRVDYLNDKDGARTSDFLGFPSNTHQELLSVTFTLNVKPLESLRIAPELRYDHSTIDTAYDGHEEQFTASVGAVFSY